MVKSGWWMESGYWSQQSEERVVESGWWSLDVKAIFLESDWFSQVGEVLESGWWSQGGSVSVVE